MEFSEKVLLFIALAVVVPFVFWYINSTYQSVVEGGEYLACGCGCCGGVAPREVCIYKSKSDNLEAIRLQDELTAKSPNCNIIGCGEGIKYKYCD